MAMTDKNTNWDLCFTFRKNTKESIRFTDNGRKNIALMLPKIERKNALGFDVNGIGCSDKELLQTL